MINLESIAFVRIAAQAIASPDVGADDELLMGRAEARIAEDAEFAAADIEQRHGHRIIGVCLAKYDSDVYAQGDFEKAPHRRLAQRDCRDCARQS